MADKPADAIPRVVEQQSAEAIAADERKRAIEKGPEKFAAHFSGIEEMQPAPTQR